MSDIAFLCHPTVGHLNTLLSTALRMKEDGHRTRFFIPGGPALPFRLRPDILNNVVDVPAMVERAGLPLERLRPALGVIFHAIRLARSSGYEESRIALKLFTAGVEATTRDILRRLERQPAEVLVTDFAFYPALLAAEKLGLPWAAVYHSGLPFRGPGIPPWGSGLPIGTPDGPELRHAETAEAVLLAELAQRVRKARRALGLEPGPEDVLRSPASPWLNLVMSHEAIEAPRTGLGPSTFYVGPCFSTRRGTDTQGFPFDKLRADAFKVYVSLGTVFNDKPEVFRTILRGLDAPGIQVIVSGGAAYPVLSSGPLPSNVLLFRRVPQVDLLPKVDLVISHGGNNTTNETLAAGKPLLVVPVGGEQHDNARRVEYLGAGLFLPMQSLSQEAVLRAVTRLREEPGFRDRAEALRQHLAATDGTGTAAALIALLAKRRAPLRIPDGAPRSIPHEGLASLLASLGDPSGSTSSRSA
ncbi:glycosyltransferase family 1 protein [Archangium violaceum]|uniref:glycosyltransferase n=1 Tax=Archangium violaceum TaxID=83451 RepID=UPI002B2A819A|nr:glycosyltransferase family 1 protein [Archangium violaceum]